MAYGHLERAWTYAEYVEKYEQLQAKNDKLVALCKHVAETAGMDMAIKLLSEIDNRKHAGISIVLQGIQDFAKAALAEAEK